MNVRFMNCNDISSFFVNTWRQHTDLPPPYALNKTEQVPAYLIRDMLYSDNFIPSNAPTDIFAYTGLNGGGISEIETCVGNINIAVEADISVLDTVGITHGEKLNSSDYHKQLIMEAVSYLNSLNSYYAKSVVDYCGTLFWITVPINYKESYPPLTSASYPALPFATFISDLAIKHIAPVEFITIPKSFALAENLFHESLHQELTILLLSNNIMSNNFNANKQLGIHIPWRNTYWAIDRVLHATYVYSNLIPFREKAADNEKGKIAKRLYNSAKEGKNILYLLSLSLHQNSYLFSSEGKKLIDSIVNNAEKVIGATVSYDKVA